VWAHTCQVVDQAPRARVLRWAALLHDVGKARTRSVEADGTVHFLGHAEVGARIARRILRRLGMPAEPATAIRFLVLVHLRASPYESSWTDSAVRRLARDIGDRFDDLIGLSRADITTQRADKRRRGLAGLDELVERTRRIVAEDARPVPLPKGLGAVLIERFGLPPGPIVGAVRRAIEEAAVRGEIPMQAPFEVYLDYARRELSHLVGGEPGPAVPDRNPEDP
jgi:poly(A) polymerase